MKRGSKLDEILTLLFMTMAIGAIVCYFAVDNRSVFYAFGGAAVLLRLVQYGLRHFGA